ncbi:MAG TPA: hypothetical protein VHO90_11960 [Bacteroidales bacterium]|nr:hypothetical protein [Bacteroidales bacterium]
MDSKARDIQEKRDLQYIAVIPTNLTRGHLMNSVNDTCSKESKSLFDDRIVVAMNNASLFSFALHATKIFRNILFPGRRFALPRADAFAPSER